MTETATYSITEEEAAGYRSRFPIFLHTNYLNSCSLGPLSNSAIEALGGYREAWAEYGAPAWWKAWMPKLAEARQRFASLIGAQPHEVTTSHSVSSALSSVASTFDYRRRPAVVCADLDFPTIAYQWLAKERDGIEVRFARSDDRIRVPFDAYEQAMDGDVAHIVTSHGFYSTGAIQPIRRLADLAHAHGAKIVVDGYHGVGVLPVNVKELNVDFYVGGTLKWLLGGPGLTFIYVREELIADLQPTITGWFAAADQFAFDTLNLDLAPSADRITLGTPSVATAYTGVAGMDIILEAGAERIYDRIQMLTDIIVRRARERGFGVISPEDRSERGGIVMLRVKKPQRTVDELGNRGITVDYRPGLVRISPHFFNTSEDVSSAMDSIAEIQDGLV
jgi:kynureninase